MTGTALAGSGAGSYVVFVSSTLVSSSFAGQALSPSPSSRARGRDGRIVFVLFWVLLALQCGHD